MKLMKMKWSDFFIKFLNNIRRPAREIDLSRQIINTGLILGLGLFLGLISKMLDCIPANELPHILEMMDVRNFLGRISIWILLAVAISLYSNTPIRAGINVFLFFIGMLVSYYTYTKFVAGFFPKSYILIWVILTIISPLLASICWHAKGNGAVALLLSSAIVGILYTEAFTFGAYYFYVKYQGLEVLVWIIGIALLYKNPKQLFQMVSLSFVIAFTKVIVYQYSFW